MSEEEKEEIDENNNDEKTTKTVQITTPYITVVVTSEVAKDTLVEVKNTAEYLMDKYKHHHLLGDKREDYS